MAIAPSPNELTRQQLDELDALLQRMLSLPLNPPDTAAPKPPEPPPPVLPAFAPNWRVDPPAAPAPHLRLTADPLPLPDPIPAPERAPLRVAATPQPEGAAPTPPEPVRVVAPRLADAPPPKPAQPPTTTAPPTPWALAPLVAVNRLTDRVLSILGPVGRVLRSGFGRTLFGVAGLALIAYTAAHVAQVQGWLALPVPLPWPR